MQINGRFKESVEKGVETKEGAKDEAVQWLSPLIEAALKKYDQFGGQLNTWIRVYYFFLWNWDIYCFARICFSAIKSS